MDHDRDAVDDIRARLAVVYPDLDTTAFEITGRVLRLAREIEIRRAQHLASYDMTPGDFDVIATLRRTDDGEGVNPGRLSESLLITSGGLTKRLDRLESAGLIERHPDPADRRAILIRMSPRGREAIDEALPALLEMEAETFGSRLTTRQLGQATTLLRRLGT
jgi:DNA-binding MarR family transcriptional regulator